MNEPPTAEIFLFLKILKKSDSYRFNDIGSKIIILIKKSLTFDAANDDTHVGHWEGKRNG